VSAVFIYLLTMSSKLHANLHTSTDGWLYRLFYLRILWGERFTLFTNTANTGPDGWTNYLLACHPVRRKQVRDQLSLWSRYNSNRWSPVPAIIIPIIILLSATKWRTHTMDGHSSEPQPDCPSPWHPQRRETTH